MWVIHPHWNLDSRVTRLNLSVAPVKLEFLLVKSRPRCATSDVVRSLHNLRPCNLESCSHCGAIGDGVGGREGSRKGWHDSSGPHCVCAWKNKEVKERHCERADGLGCVGSEDYFSTAKNMYPPALTVVRQGLHGCIYWKACVYVYSDNH